MLDHLLADLLAANQREAGAGDRAAKLIGHGGEVDRDGLADGGEGGGVGRVGMHNAVDIRPVAVDIQVAGRVG